MTVIKKDFPSILKENEIAYFSLLEGVIASIDNNSTLEERKLLNSYSFRISPSLPSYINSLVQEINSLNNMLNIRVEWGKSFKNSAIITFFLTIN